MKCSTYQAVSVPAGPAFQGFDDSFAETGGPVGSAELERSAAGESLFENFVDEVDAWARRALAANGFGDYL